MEIRRSGSQPSTKGPADWFTGTVRVDPLFEAPEPAREWRKRHVGAGAVRELRIRLVKTLLAGVMAFWSCQIATLAQDSSPPPSSVDAEHASEIPNGYEVGKDSVSPDGRFAILYPLQNTADDKGNYPPNLLVRLKPCAVLATVEKDGLPQNVTTQLLAQWNGNSMVAIWEYRKWGIVDLNVYDIENESVKRVQPVWREVKKVFERDFRSRFLKKYPDEYDSVTIVSEHGAERGKGDFRFDDRHLVLDLSADNKPNLAGGPHWTAELHSLWNLDTGKLETVDLRPGKISVRPSLKD